MSLPATARGWVAVSVAGGLACLGLALAHAGEMGHLRAIQWAVVALLAVPTTWGWFSPLVLYRGAQAEAFHLDEAAFVLLSLLLPAPATIFCFAVITIGSQLFKRRPPVKVAFNVGQVLVAVGLGLLASRAIATPGRSLTPLDVAAVAVGTVVFFVVNSALVAGILTSLGSTLRACLLDGLYIRLALAGSGAILGLMLALATSVHGWAVVLVAPGMVALRLTIGAKFRAEHDRERVQGLFDVALEAHSGLRRESVLTTLVEASARLLRCDEVRVVDVDPGQGALAVPLAMEGQERWLVASGRGPGRPFDEADCGLLRAVAALAQGALNNAELYRQVGYERSRLSSITLNIGEGVCAVDTDGYLTFVNPAAAAMVALPAVSVPIADSGDRTALLAPDFLLVPARQAMRTGRVVREDDARFAGRDGGTLAVAYTASVIHQDGEVAGAVIAFRDITERKALEDEMVHRAFYDSLTHLPNRRMLVERLEQALARSELDHQVHALIFVDVDRFKSINDSLGHGTGDELLVAIGARMRDSIRSHDLLARFGGDEFVVLLENVAGGGAPVSAARRICATLEEPIVLSGGFEIVASVSVGISLTEPGQTADDVLRDADVAMYRAKGRGGSYEIFDKATMGTRSSERLDLEAALRKGLEREELEVYYQPIVSLDDMRIVDAEALVRWQHPSEGLLRPARFIPMAEETGLILPLGNYVLERACQQVRAIRDRLGIEIPVSVNLSPRQFQRCSLLADVTRTLDRAGLAPDLLMFEITETMVMDDLAGAREVMKKLNRLGVRLAIDDFGTGHSSLGYLKQFPVQTVKVDRSFTRGVACDPVDSAIVRAVVSLADAMGIVSVAEGVETAEQLSALQAQGCHRAQGYHFARPLTAERYLAMLEERLPVSLDLRLV